MLAVVYVDDSATGLNDGTSWADAYTSLQAALTAAVAGQEIRVGQGTYKPTTGTDRTVSFALKNGVAIYGGYAGLGAPDPDARNIALYATVLSGDIGAQGDATDNSYHVVVASGTDSTAVLDGFTTTGGNANGISSNACGGGMYMSGGIPTLSNCTFTANSGSSGGGMYNTSSSPMLTNCTFSANSAISLGGGMYNTSSSPTLTNCTFSANSASSKGAGMYNTSSSPTLTKCAFTANSGSGMYNEYSPSLTVTNCTFTANSGSGMSNSSSSSPTVTNCTFTANSGSGMTNSSSSPTLTNCTFLANSAASAGGMGNSSSSPTLTNCTFIANSASSSGGGGMNNGSSSPALTNCVLWANTAPSGRQIYDSGSGTPVVTYCDVQGGYSGAGNIDMDPQIVHYPGPGPDGAWGTADDEGDLRLHLSSPCIDAGKNAAVPANTTTDMAGNARFADVPARADTGAGTAPLVDMGAYEAPAAVQALAGGPYCVIEGGSFVLAGAGHSPTGLGVSYAWDLDGDGQFDDASGPAPVFSAAGMLGPQTLTIALRVSDVSGATAVDTAVLRVLQPLYVDDSSTGLNNGATWADAYTDLQVALTLAVPGRAIAVAQGTYKPTAGADRAATFSLRTGVAIYGGFAGRGATDPAMRDVGIYPSTLSGDVGIAGSAADNSYHVVTASGTNTSALLDGFTITGGNANGISATANGGGMYTSGGSPTLVNCTFTVNSATSGGGMYSDHGSPMLIGCTFTANSASSGAGVYNYHACPTLTNCTFTANSANGSGGGMYSSGGSPTLVNCTLTANSANGGGGGMFGYDSAATVTNCTLTANSAVGSGGGMYNNRSDPMLANCTFIANSSGDGGAMRNSTASPTLTNCTFLANSAIEGGALYNSSRSPTLTNCTFAANSATLGGAMRNTSLSSPNLTNCILWANMASSGSQIHNSDSAPVVTYCDIQDGHSGAGNIDLDPLFVRNPGPGPDGMWRTEDDDPGDLRLRLISPCIDAGKNSAAPTGILTDKAGNPRFVDVPASADTGSGTAPLVDMGAYEAPAALQAVDGGPYRVVEGCSIVLAGAGYSPTGRAVSYAWDFNGDGQFDDATGPTPVFSAAGILGPHTLTIALRVTDTSDATAVDTTVLRVLRPDYYVDDSAAGLNNGTSWADAYTGLQPALAAAVPGQVIAVAQGTYKPTAGTDRTGTFSLKGGVALYGGFAGHGAPGPSTRDVGLYLSILSGDIGTARSTADNSYHVVTASGTDPTAVLDGFAITAGTADGSSENAFGGGMYIGGGSPTLTNCTFIASSAGFGGGMYSTASSPTLTNCTFIANSASSGGGMYNNSSSPTLTDCTFIANSAGSGGGMSNDFSHTALTNCAFAANAATYGGGMYSNYSWPTLANCILWANTAPTGSQIFAGGGASVVTYSDIHGGYSGAGNKNLDPQFVRNPGPGPDGTWRTADDDYGDLRLRPSSPCIDAGNNSAVPTGISTDLAGNPRFADVPAVADTGSGTAPIVDMGAYESPNPNLVLGGTDGPDEFSLSQSPDQASIRIVGPGGSNTYSVLAITAITVNGGQGDDRLTVDFGNGNPVPTGGVTFDGQGGSDSVRIVAPGNNATLNGEQVSVGTAAPIGFSNTEGTSFDLGTGRLTKAGSSAAVLVGGSTYAGGTEVLGGTLVVGQANALPAGGGLTIGAGATVVLPSGLIQAVADEPGSAVAQDQTGGGQWQVDSGQWTVDSPLSTVHCLPATVHGLPSTVQPRASLCSSAPTLQHSLPTTIARRHAFDVVMRSMDAQGWQQLVLVTTGQQAARKMKGCRWGEIALNEAHDPML